MRASPRCERVRLRLAPRRCRLWASVRGGVRVPGTERAAPPPMDGEKRPMPGHRRRPRRPPPHGCPGHGPAGAAASPPGARWLPASSGSGHGGMICPLPSPLRASQQLGRRVLSIGSREGVHPQVYLYSARFLGFLFLPPSPKTFKKMDGYGYL